MAGGKEPHFLGQHLKFTLAWQNLQKQQNSFSSSQSKERHSNPISDKQACSDFTSTRHIHYSVLSVWSGEGNRRASYWHHKTPSLPHWSGFIYWLNGPGTRSRYLSKCCHCPWEDALECFISVCQVARWCRCSENYSLHYSFFAEGYKIMHISASHKVYFALLMSI